MSAAIQALWDSGALGGIFTAIVSVFGQMAALNTQKFSATLDALAKAQSADSSAHDAAIERTKDDGGAWTRRIMMFAAFVMIGIAPIVFAFFKDIPVAVETVESTGGWLWGLIPEKESFAVAYVNGFYLADVWKELLANLVSAYVGAGLTRKAFKLGK